MMRSWLSPRFTWKPGLMVLGVGQLILMGLQFMQLQQLNQLATSHRTVLVDDVTGSSFRVVPLADTQDRHPKEITKFASYVVYTAFDWALSPNAQDADTFVVETEAGEVDVPANLWAASLMVANDFRGPFRERLAALVTEQHRSGHVQSMAEIEQMSEPELLQPGKWQLDVRGVVNSYEGNRQRGSTPFYWRMVIRTVNPAVVPQGDTPLEQLVFEMQQLGLQVDSIQEKEWGELDS